MRDSGDKCLNYGKQVEEVTTLTESDWAGCKETRKSSSAGVVMFGEHALQSYTRKQKVIARSSAEAELYAALGASESKGIASLLGDPGYERKPVLAIDAKATEHFLHRKGIGKLKHIEVAYLWLQDEIRSQRLRVCRVRSGENVADLVTKPLGKAVIVKHCLAMGYANMNEENDENECRIVAMFWDFSQQRLRGTEAAAVSAAAAASRPGGQRSVCEKLMPWILTNPTCVMNRWVDYHAMDQGIATVKMRC